MKQKIDEFCKNLNPEIKKSVFEACESGVKARVKCLNEAYPETNKIDELRVFANELRNVKLSELLEEAVENLEANGIKVHFAETIDEARKISEQILSETECKKVVKVKSMTTEELELNEYLEEKGFQITETDLGEFIIQIRHEKPSHIVKPAIHLNRKDFAESFEKFNVSSFNDDPKGITQNARRYLRKKYLEADAVISGANYVLAKEGGIVLCTNEGNARFSLAGARVHIAFAGFEKIIPSKKELAVFLNLLARSATGQDITVYTDFIFGAGKSKNSPKEMHLIFLDNGRSKIYESDFSEILKCIRCGTCMFKCPVFKQVSGHAYRATYPGPLGIVLSPLLGEGDGSLNELGDLPKACTLCGGCTEVCPSKIPLSDLILKMRDRVKSRHIKIPNDVNMKPFRILTRMPFIWRLSMRLNRLANLFPISLIKFGPLGRWQSSRKLPKLRGGKFRAWMKGSK